MSVNFPTPKIEDLLLAVMKPASGLLQLALVVILGGLIGLDDVPVRDTMASKPSVASTSGLSIHLPPWNQHNLLAASSVSGLSKLREHWT